MKPNHFDSDEFQRSVNRRTFLGRAAYGLGGMALASLLNPGLVGSVARAAEDQQWQGIVNPPLKELDGKPFPESFTKGQQLAQLQGAELKARGAFCEFKTWGKSGQEISTLFPHIGSIADDICIVRSMHTEQIRRTRS